MRMMYTTPRLENADRVAQIFIDHGIAARVTNSGGWRGRNHQRFSYFDSAKHRGSWPQVWVIRSEDQPRARQLLRELGVEPATRFAEQLDFERDKEQASPIAKRRTLVTRVRLILLASIAVLVILVLVRWLQEPATMETPANQTQIQTLSAIHAR